MDRRNVFGLVAAAAMAGSQVLRATPGQDEPECFRSHTKWVADAMIRMQTIKTGMTREKLLTVFQEEGGLSTRLRRTFVSQDCPYFKVDVEFEPADSPDGVEEQKWLNGRSEDKIVKISGPYLQFSIMD